MCSAFNRRRSFRASIGLVALFVVDGQFASEICLCLCCPVFAQYHSLLLCFRICATRNSGLKFSDRYGVADSSIMHMQIMSRWVVACADDHVLVVRNGPSHLGLGIGGLVSGTEVIEIARTADGTWIQHQGGWAPATPQSGLLEVARHSLVV